MAASRASDRNGPISRAAGFFSRISFSIPMRASGTGTPGAASRMSMDSTEHSLFGADLHPPFALISSTAICTTASPSFPSRIRGCRHTDDNRIRRVRGEGEHKTQDQKETHYPDSSFHAFPPFIWLPMCEVPGSMRKLLGILLQKSPKKQQNSHARLHHEDLSFGISAAACAIPVSRFFLQVSWESPSPTGTPWAP